MLSKSLIDRYLARSIAVPLIGTLVLAAMLLILDKMLRLFDFVVTAGRPVSVVWRMLANLLPEYFGLGIPIGLMLGILLAFRKLALSSELDAMRGIGMGFGRLLRVPYFYAIVLMAITFLIVGFIEPYARYRYEGLRFDLRSGALGASIKVGEFNQLGKRLTLRIDRSLDRGTRLEGIFIAVDQGAGGAVTATAESGRFLATDDPDTILFRLQNGRLVQQSPKFTTPRTLAFDSYDLPIAMPRIDQFRRRGDDNPELTMIELIDRAGEPRSSPAERRSAIANLHFRLVEVAMMLLIPLLAVALAVPPKRSTSALGIFVGIIVMVTYHKVNQYAEQMGAQGRIDPVIALWVPFFLLLAALILWMYRVIAVVPGGQPIGALERFAARIARQLRRLLVRVPGLGGRAVINLHFFPSLRLATYMVRLFLVRSLAVLLSLVLILMTLDLLGESGKILAVPGNGDAELWRYVFLRIPQLVSRFLPFSVLLGALITFTGLNQHSEVIAMKASGISAHQILAPLIVASLGVAVVHFWFNERVVTAATRIVTAWSDADYRPIPPDSGIVSNAWVLAGDNLIRARQVIGSPPAVRLQGVTIYEREQGEIVRVLDADRAVPAAGGWQLETVRIYDARMNMTRQLARLGALAGVEPQRFTLAKVRPDERDFFSLRGTIEEMRRAGRPTTEVETGYWHKLTGPLSTMLMPLLAAVAAFGLARSGQVLLRATLGMALGFTFFVVDNFSLAMGNLGAYPPVLAAAAPLLLFLLIGEMVLIQTEE